MNDPSSLPQRTKAFFESCNTAGEAALVELPSLFADDLTFQCPVGTRYGLNAYRDFWKLTFLPRYKEFRFDDFEVLGTPEKFALFYRMTVQMKVGAPISTPTAGLFYARDGKIIKQIDYWDTVGGLTEICKPIATGYKWTMGKLFGGGHAVQGIKGVADPIR